MAKLARSTRKHPRGRSNGRPTSRPRKHRRTLVSKPLQRSIAREASQLGLSIEEYVRMANAISKSFRETVQTDQSFDMKSLAKVVDSPIWPFLMQTIGPVVTGMLESPSKVEKEPADERPRTALQPPAERVPRPHPGYLHTPGLQVPVQSIPNQQVPNQQVPNQPVPNRQVPSQQGPGQQTPGQTWSRPRQPMPYEYW